jgi:hypothetical protein
MQSGALGAWPQYSLKNKDIFSLVRLTNVNKPVLSSLLQNTKKKLPYRRIFFPLEGYDFFLNSSMLAAMSKST